MRVGGFVRLRRAAVSATCIFAVVSLVVPTAAAASGVTPGTSAAASPSGLDSLSAISCANPPSYSSATTPDCNRFVQLWTPRLTNKTWLQSYADQSSVPSDIQAEGFHSLDKPTQGWLVESLVNAVVQTQGYNGMPAGSTPPSTQIQQTDALVALVIFGKDQINQLRQQGQQTAPNPGPPQPSILQGKVDTLATPQPPPATPNANPVVSPTSPTTSSAANLTTTGANPVIANLTTTRPTPAVAPTPAPAITPPPAATPPIDPNSLLTLVLGILGMPPISSLLGVVDQVLTSIANIEQQLFAIPGLNILGGLTYRVCAESATQPLACTINLPVGVPIPVNVTGNHVPDVLATLTPVLLPPQVKIISLLPPVVQIVPSSDLAFSFDVRRLTTGPALPAHVFVVYDPPLTGKRVEYGYDGRASTLADDSNTTFTLKSAFNALRGDVEVVASITHVNPGSTEAETVAVKTLQTRSGQLPAEVDPIAGAIRFTPVPTSITADAHLQHVGKDEDTVSVDSNLSSTVNALLTQDENATLPATHRQFSALVNQLPQHVSVDLLHQNPQQVITYGANAVINNIQVSQKSLDDIAHPGSFTENDATVQGLPTSVKLTLVGANDVLYAGSSVVPAVQFATQTQQDSVLQNEIVATAHGLPKNVHVNNATAMDSTKMTYDADSSLTDIGLGIFDLANDRTIINALAKSLPLHAQLNQVKSTGVTDYTSSGPIGLIQATLSRAGGATIPMPGVDHVTFLKSGNGIGVDAQIAGVIAAHADPSNNATYSLTMSPGGQEFKGLAQLDGPNRIANVDISNLPSNITVTIDPSNGKATYSASAIINSVDGSYQQPDVGQIAHFTLNQVPKNITATWQPGGNKPMITYNADSRLGSLSAFYQQATGHTSFLGQVTDLPLYMQVAGVDPITFDARTSPAAASASDHVGQIALQYASDATLGSTGDPNDHLYLSSLPSATHAELVYSGLQFFSVDTSGQNLHAEVKNTAPRLFDVTLATPNLTLNGFVNKVPSDVQVNMVGQELQYQASSPITEIGAVLNRTSGDVINADVTGIPSAIDVVFDSANSKLNWNASAATGGINVQTHFLPATTGNGRTVDAALTITNVPATWDASYGSGHLLFEAISGPVGLITSQFTNHGSTTTFAQDGLSVVFNQGTGDLDAFLQVSQLNRAEFQKLAPSGSGAGGFDAVLNMGTGGNFALNGQLITNDGTLLNATGSIQGLPTAMHLRSEDGLITYNGNQNPTLDLSVAYGGAAAVAAAPAAPVVHGLAVRDGAAGGSKAIKAHVFLTGLPTGLSFDTVGGVYSVTGFNPTIDPTKIDVALSNFVPTPITLVATQNVSIGSPVNFVFGPMVTGTDSGGAKQIHAQYTASRAMGAFVADATAGANVAHLEVSNIPSSLTLDTSFGADTKTINVGLGQSINEIKALYKRVTDATYVAGADLTSVPTSVKLVIGKQDGGQGITAPNFSYHASSPGMGLMAFVDVAAFSSTSARVQLSASNLGADVTAGLSGTTLSLASSPATGSLTLIASAIMNFNFNLGFSAGPFTNTGNLGVNLNVTQLTIGFTNMNSLTLKLGYSTAIEGNYGTFTFGEQSDTHIDVHDHLDVDLGVVTIHGIVGVDINNLDLGNVIGDFRMADNVLGSWMSFPLPLPPCVIVPFFGHINLRPHPRFTSSGSTFTVSSSDTEGSGVWIATVNPLGIVPDFVSDIIARFASPDGGDQSFSVSCGP
jgi:hypothetical protein